jgi:hypothetical protein
MVPVPRLTPTLTRLTPGGSRQFDFQGDPQEVAAWRVNGTPGGNRDLGTIDENGFYLAPGKPSRTEVVVEAVLGTRRAWATVILDTRRDAYRYSGSWNRKGENLTEAHSIALEPSGTMLIGDPQQSRVLRFTTKGDYIGEIGSGKGSEPGYFDGPRDITTDPEGNIYVADGNNCRLQAFDPEGELLSCVGAKGSGACEFLRPHSLDVGPDGNIYVIDVDNSRVTVHDKMGGLLRSWGKRGKMPGEFWSPHGIAVDPNGDVIVADFYGRCQRFTGEGELLYIFANPSRKSLPAIDPSFGAMALGHGDPTHGYYRFHAMTSDHLGNVYLMARNMLKKRACSVDKYNGSGELVASVTLPPEVKRRMGGQGAAVSREGRLYVSDTGPTHAGVMIFDPT